MPVAFSFVAALSKKKNVFHFPRHAISSDAAQVPTFWMPSRIQSRNCRPRNMLSSRRRPQSIKFAVMSDANAVATVVEDVTGTIGSGGESLVHPGRGIVRGGFGLEFLGVAGGLATMVALFGFPISVGLAVFTGFALPPSRIVVAVMSFAYGIILSRFDLAKMRKLKLTITFALITRFVCVPVLSHSLSLLLSSVLHLLSNMQISCMKPGNLLNSGHSLSTDIASGLLLLSVTPAGFSPSVSMLSPYMYPTLFAHLALLTFLFFPILPYLSYWMNMLLRQNKLLSVGGILPRVSPPPSVATLLLCTTVPAILAITTNRFLSRRWTAIFGLCALPLAWFCVTYLTFSVFTRVVSLGVVDFSCGILMSGIIMLAMGLLGRLLGAALRLDVRAKRTLLLYLCSQGSAAASGLSRSPHSAFPFAASAVLGIVMTYVLFKRWGEVVIRKSLHDG